MPRKAKAKKPVPDTDEKTVPAPSRKTTRIEQLPYLETIEAKIREGFSRLMLIGGTRSGKSFQTSILIIKLALNPKAFLSPAHIKRLEAENREGLFIVIARQKCVDMDITIKLDLERILRKMEIYPENGVDNRYIHINKLKNYIRFKNNGSEIWFSGADREGKGMGAAPDICWFNEISEISEGFYKQIYKRMTMFALFDCNPKMGHMHWARTQLLAAESSSPDNGGVFVHRSTFRDNKFLPKEQVDRILSFEPTPQNIAAGTADEYEWRVYGLGVFAIKEGLVFNEYKDWDTIPDNQFPEQDAAPWCWALDVGYQDKMAFGRVAIKEGNIYIDELIYESGLSITTPAENPHKDSLIKRFPSLGVKRGDLIIYDAASASTGAALAACGYVAQPCRKEGAGRSSIVPQLSAMKNYHIRVTQRSLGWRGEAAEYAWKGDNTDAPPKAGCGDHSIDMSRYGATYLIRSDGGTKKVYGGRLSLYNQFFKPQKHYGSTHKEY